MDQVAKLCSHVVVLNEGALVAQGALDELQAASGQASLEDMFLQLTRRPAQA